MSHHGSMPHHGAAARRSVPVTAHGVTRHGRRALASAVGAIALSLAGVGAAYGVTGAAAAQPGKSIVLHARAPLPLAAVTAGGAPHADAFEARVAELAAEGLRVEHVKAEAAKAKAEAEARAARAARAAAKAASEQGATDGDHGGCSGKHAGADGWKSKAGA